MIIYQSNKLKNHKTFVWFVNIFRKQFYDKNYLKQQ